MKAQRGIEVYLYTFFNLDARWRWVVNATLRPLYLRERDLLSIVYEEAGWASEPVWMGTENSPPGFIPATCYLKNSTLKSH
jgi:hypothetical protein